MDSFAGIFQEFCLDFESIFFPVSSESLLPNGDFLVEDFLERRDIYNFRSCHQVEGVLFYDNSTNICSVIDCSKFRVEVSEKDCGGFHFYWSVSPTAFSFPEE